MEDALRKALRRWHSNPRDVDALARLARVSQRAGVPLPEEVDPDRVLGAFVARLHASLGRGNESGYEYTAVGQATRLHPPFDDLEGIRGEINRLPRLHDIYLKRPVDFEASGLPFPCRRVFEIQFMEHPIPLDVDLFDALTPYPERQVYEIYADYEPEDRAYSMYESQTVLVWLPSLRHAHLIVTQHHWGCWHPPG